MICKKLGKYIIREVTNISDVVCVVRDRENLIESFENMQNPKSISVDDLKDTINMAIQKNQVKNYVNREAGLTRNLYKIYGFVWGQCSHGIKSKIRNNEYFE